MQHYSALVEIGHSKKVHLIDAKDLTKEDVNKHLNISLKNREMIIVGKAVTPKYTQRVSLGSGLDTNGTYAARYIITCKKALGSIYAYVVDNQGKGLTHSQVEECLPRLYTEYPEVQVGLLQSADFCPELTIEDDQYTDDSRFYVVAYDKFWNYTLFPDMLEFVCKAEYAYTLKDLQELGAKYDFSPFTSMQIYMVIEPVTKTTLVIE